MVNLIWDPLDLFSLTSKILDVQIPPLSSLPIAVPAQRHRSANRMCHYEISADFYTIWSFSNNCHEPHKARNDKWQRGQKAIGIKNTTTARIYYSGTDATPSPHPLFNISDLGEGLWVQMHYNNNLRNMALYKLNVLEVLNSTNDSKPCMPFRRFPIIHNIFIK